MKTDEPEAEQLGKIKELNGDIIVDHFIDGEFVVIEQTSTEKQTIFVGCENIKKLITILKKIK